MHKKKYTSLKERVSSDDRTAFISELLRFFSHEYNVEIGNFEGEELFELFCEKAGPIFYNQGIVDAQKFFRKRMHEIDDDIAGILL